MIYRKAYEQEVHPSGETLSENHKLWHVKVVTTFMKAGVPLAKIDHFRELLEERTYRLSDRRGMYDLIPFVQSEEQHRIRAELQGKRISVIFDGTTRLGEALVIVVRFVDGFMIKQCLVRFLTLAKSMTGEEIARELISALSVEYGITSERLLAAMRDRASVNGVAMQTIKVVFPDTIDVVGCYSHTTDLVGEKFRTPNLDNFMHLWISLFAHSPRARLWWEGRTGKAMSSYSSTRWWSKWEVMSQVMLFFGDVAPFLQANPELSPATNQKLLEMLQNPSLVPRLHCPAFFALWKNTGGKRWAVSGAWERGYQNPTVKAYLQIELAAVVDAGEAFVKATYNLEGDDPLVLRCYDCRHTSRPLPQRAGYCSDIVRRVTCDVSAVGGECQYLH